MAYAVPVSVRFDTYGRSVWGVSGALHRLRLAGPVVGGPGGRRRPPAGTRVVAVNLPGRTWLAHNVDVVAGLADGEAADVVAVPRAGSGFRRWGVLDDAGGRGPAAAGGLTDFWQRLVAVLGPSPYRRVQVLLGPHDYPLGLSFPGAVVLSHRLLASPLRARWLYLAHELVHQWFGNTVRFAPGTGERWEGWVDAVTWVVAESVAGPGVGATFHSLFRRYLRSADALRRRGEHVLAYRTALDHGAVTIAAQRPRLSLPRGVREFAPPPPCPSPLEAYPC